MSAGLVRALELALFPLVWTTKKLMPVPARWWKRLPLAMVSAAFGVVVWTRFAIPHHTLGSDQWASVTDIGLISGYVCVWALWVGVLLVCDIAGVAIVRWIATTLPRSGKGALAIARHTLESRQAFTWAEFWTAKAELGGIVVMALFVCGTTAGFSIERAASAQESALSFDAVVLPPEMAQNPESSALGVDTVILDADVLAELADNALLAVVPFGRVTVGPIDVAAPTASILVVDPADLDRVVPGGARPLGFQDGLLLSPETEAEPRPFPAPTRLVDVSTGSGAGAGSGPGATTLFNRPWFNATTLATRGWAESVWGDVPIVGALVSYTGEGLTADARYEVVADAALEAGVEVEPAPRMSAEDIDYHRGAQDFSIGASRFVAALFAVVASFGIVTLAVRTVKRHRHVRATVAALGATPRALALAIPIDALVVLLVAFGMAIPLGGLAAAFAKHPTLLVYGAPANPGFTAWGLWWNFTHIAWGQVLAASALTVVAAVAASAIYGFTAARRTPVDELREAIKEGVA